MFTVIHFYYLMCLFRIKPDHAPKGRVLVSLIIVANILVQFLILLSNDILKMPFALALGWAVVFTASSAGCIWTLLRFADKVDRFTSAFCSWQGCSLVLSLPILLIAQLANPEQEPANALGSLLLVLLGIASLGLQAWTVVISVVILKSALEMSTPAALASFIFITLVSAALVITILPAPPGLLEALASTSGLLETPPATPGLLETSPPTP